MTFSATEKLAAVEREIGYRLRVYARRVAEGKMSKELADRQVAIFEEIAADYREKAKTDAGPLFA